ncbi:MAG: electron transfer flavoprotein subunit beta/FixA family protein [Lachnospiraceae bacterium]|nr:electron transfer flavoprotein subunit beta/FixA family protein [Lachnospiraceae bacterium]MDE7285377.1 electron transfer flavoprotein subunit beta/FixA family protein [Lachnospiraceae bacterium]
MKIVVCIKQVPDTTEIRIDPVTNTLIRAGVPSIINPADMNAIEAAVQLKEKHGGHITVVTMGPPQAAKALRYALSMGADEAILVSDRTFGGSDTYATSYILSQTLKKIGNFDLIFCGKQAIDGDTGQVGPELAEHMGISQVTFVSGLEMSGEKISAVRSLEDVSETVEASLPVVITVMDELNTPRYPEISRMVKAYATEITVWGVDAFEAIDKTKIGLKGSPTSVKKTFAHAIEKENMEITGESDEAKAAVMVQYLKTIL